MHNRLALASLLLAALAVANPPAASGYVIVTRTGIQLLTLDPPEIQGNLVRFTHHPTGIRLQMRIHNVDVAASERLSGVSLGLPPGFVPPVHRDAPLTRPGRIQSGWDLFPPGFVITNRELKELMDLGRTRHILEIGDLLDQPPEESQIPDANAILDQETARADEEAEWRARASVLREQRDSISRKRATARAQVDSIRKAMQGLGAATSNALSRELSRAEEELGIADAEYQVASQAIQRLEEEARVAGIPPSWIR